MTQLERELIASLDSKYTLYKYHDDVNYDDGIPDVVDFLYDCLDEQKEYIKKLSYEQYRYKSADDRGYLSDAREVLAGIEKCIADLETTDAIYYIGEESERIRRIPVEPLNGVMYELAYPFIDNKRELTWCRVGKQVRCFEVIDPVTSLKQIIPEIPEYDGHKIDTGSSYSSSTSYYLLERVTFHDFYTHIICPDCGEEWLLSSKEKKFFIDQHLVVPKRCTYCRCRRRERRRENA